MHGYKLLGQMNIVLIGYRCTGKSTTGHALSKRLRMPFFDTDYCIETRLRKSIKQVVEEGGWPLFRKVEREMIKEVSSKNNVIIATGGGAVLNQENVNDLKRNGVMVLLEADVSTIVKRLKEDTKGKDQRPQFTYADLYTETITVLERRRPIYRRVADIVLDTSRMSQKEVVEAIVRTIKVGEDEDAGK